MGDCETHFDGSGKSVLGLGSLITTGKILPEKIAVKLYKFLFPTSEKARKAFEKVVPEVPGMWVFMPEGRGKKFSFGAFSDQNLNSDKLKAIDERVTGNHGFLVQDSVLGLLQGAAEGTAPRLEEGRYVSVKLKLDFTGAAEGETKSPLHQSELVRHFLKIVREQLGQNYTSAVLLSHITPDGTAIASRLLVRAGEKGVHDELQAVDDAVKRAREYLKISDKKIGVEISKFPKYVCASRHSAPNLK